MVEEATEDAGLTPGQDDKGKSSEKQQKGRRAFRRPTTKPATPWTKEAKFEGRVDELTGYTYDCTDSKQTDGYTKTTREIAKYVGRTYKYGAGTRLAIESLAGPQFDEPQDPPENASRTMNRIWGK